MRILGHIHTLNDEDVIDRSLGALLAQTRPLQEILIVDNGSTDRTLARVWPKHTTVVRHEQNLGTNGSVITGFRYALSHGYDWIWIFDADSAPRADALQRLVELYESFTPEVQSQTRALTSLPVDSVTRRHYHGVLFTRTGTREVTPQSDQSFYEYDGAMWTGSLFKLQAVRDIGLPPADYVLDWGEYEYGYKGKKSGYKAFMHVASIVDHNIGGQTSMRFKPYGFGRFSLPMIELPPIRCYYVVRNTLFFWLHEYEHWNVHTVVPHLIIAAAFTFNFLVRPFSHWKESKACLRGLWDGIFRRMDRRY